MSVNAINYALAYVTKPSAKIQPGEISGIKRILKDSFEIPVGGFSNAVGLDPINPDNRILSLILPEGALITDCKIKVDHMSVGSAGTFTVGTVADPDGLIVNADGAADDSLERCGNNSPLLWNRMTEDTQIIIECGVTVGAGDAGKKLEWEVEYVIN